MFIWDSEDPFQSVKLQKSFSSSFVIDNILSTKRETYYYYNFVQLLSAGVKT